MADVREQILVRLGTIFEAVAGIEKVSRNDIVRSDAKDSVSYLDGDEEADQEDMGRGRPNEAPRRVVMTPEIYINLAKASREVGTKLNEYRGKIISAVFSDAVLRTIIGANGKIEYLGCSTDLGRGREMLGELGLGLAFHYILKPNEL